MNADRRVKRKISMNKFLRYVVTIGLVTSASVTFCVEPNAKGMVPLIKYVEKNDLKDPAAITYVYDRCIGLFLAFTISVKNQTGSEAEKMYANSKAAYTDIATAEALLILKTTKNPDAAQQEHAEVVKKLQKYYTVRMNKVMDLGQDLMEDEIVGGDFSLCGDVLKTVRSKK